MIVCIMCAYPDIYSLLLAIYSYCAFLFLLLFQIYKLSLKSEHCSDVHRLLAIECICAFAPGEEGDKLRFDYHGG